MSSYWVYILASKRNGTLYVGMTADLAARVYAHREEAVDGFTKEHGVKTLVHAEQYDDLTDARNREKLLKRWKRKWKLEPIEAENPQWRDLYDDLLR